MDTHNILAETEKLELVRKVKGVPLLFHTKVDFHTEISETHIPYER